MLNNVIYKVYCGQNGKFYTYKEKAKAESLFTKLSLKNWHTYIIKIENKTEEVIAEYR